jgi:hypothetical protein
MRLWRYLLKVRWPNYEWRNLPREKVEVFALADMVWKQQSAGSYPCGGPCYVIPGNSG